MTFSSFFSHVIGQSSGSTPSFSARLKIEVSSRLAAAINSWLDKPERCDWSAVPGRPPPRWPDSDNPAIMGNHDNRVPPRWFSPHRESPSFLYNGADPDQLLAHPKRDTLIQHQNRSYGHPLLLTKDRAEVNCGIHRDRKFWEHEPFLLPTSAKPRNRSPSHFIKDQVETPDILRQSAPLAPWWSLPLDILSSPTMKRRTKNEPRLAA